MKASDLLVRCLETEGITHVFGVPGEENADIMMSLQASPIRFVLTRHEQGAAFMAEVYGRLTVNPAVCLGTLGPGATNLITGVADANMDRAPVVAIAGQGSTTRMHKESHQILDLVNLFQPITKYSSQIREPDIVSEVVRKAFKVAQTEKPGACFIDFPENVAEGEVGGRKPIEVQAAYTSAPPEFKIAEAADPLGVLIHDRQSAIVVHTDLDAAVIPVTLRIHGIEGAPRTEWNMEVASHRVLTPMLVFAAITNAIGATAAELRDRCARAFPGARVTFEPDVKRQAIVDSWPAELDDSRARRDWGFLPAFDFARAFDEYLVPNIRARYQG